MRTTSIALAVLAAATSSGVAIAAQCIPIDTAALSESRCIEPGTGKSAWFKDCEACPELVVVPAGVVKVTTTPISEKDMETAGDTPIEIPAPFAIGRLAVTFEQWDACVADGGCDGYAPPDNGWGRGNLPVINVSFDDAVSYTAWLSRKTAKTYRLPTSAEREFAARAGTSTAFWWGDFLTLDKANADVPIRSDVKPQDVTDGTANVRYRTMPADSFEPNPWGLYSVHGNVWEWTSDCATSVPDELAPPPDPDVVATPVEPCHDRISRGGSWIDFAYLARSNAYVAFPAGSRNYAQGFRVVRELGAKDH